MTQWCSSAPRDSEVAACVGDGLSNAELATRLSMGAATVKTHIGHLFEKLEATNRTGSVDRSQPVFCSPAATPLTDSNSNRCSSASAAEPSGAARRLRSARS